jgi:hypothetical protein
MLCQGNSILDLVSVGGHLRLTVILSLCSISNHVIIVLLL